MAEVRMPKMGDGMEEGTLLRWIKKEGDTIAVNDEIAEIETDKANVPVPAEDAGTLTKIVVQEGQTVPVGAVIAYIGEAGSSATSASNGAKSAQPTSTPSADPVKTGEAGSASQEAGTTSSLPKASEAAPAVGPEAERVKASPLARKMAEEQGIDLAQIKGTGGGVGRIVQRDVEAFLKQRGSSPVGLPSAPSAPLAATAAPTLAGEDQDVGRMRVAIARRTVQSKQTVPHFYLVMPVEMDRAMALLAQMNEQAPDQKVTVNDLIVKACAVALATFPEVNVSWTPENKIRRYPQINIGVAVGTDNGLTIPVVNDCGSKTLRRISAEAKGLIKKARDGQLTPQEMSGGTFSVSNLGMFGVEEFLAIINPPESAILAVGTVAKEVAVGDGGSFEARQRMRVTLSCDHRTVDGLLGARFLAEVKRLLEAPLNLLA
jgi:pyruvate dehydrogenase E2 component (dihydrolipoamide acetyltransferase)